MKTRALFGMMIVAMAFAIATPAGEQYFTWGNRHYTMDEMRSMYGSAKLKHFLWKGQLYSVDGKTSEGVQGSILQVLEGQKVLMTIGEKLVGVMVRGSDVVDGDAWSGVIVRGGNLTYTTTAGATKTVRSYIDVTMTFDEYLDCFKSRRITPADIENYRPAQGNHQPMRVTSH